jgi:hypothetical protein
MLYMCPHTTHIHAFCYMCRPAAVYVSAYYCIQVEADDLLLTVVAESTFIEWLQRLQASLNRALTEP